MRKTGKKEKSKRNKIWGIFTVAAVTAFVSAGCKNVENAPEKEAENPSGTPAEMYSETDEAVPEYAGSPASGENYILVRGISAGSGSAGICEVTPAQKLAPGEHYILVQKDFTGSGSSVWIYDENWNCTASFQRAFCSSAGITAARYLAIDFLAFEPNEEDEEERWISGGIYDLAEEEFVDFGALAAGGVLLLDGEFGYFEYYGDWPNVKVIDREGKVLLEHIPIYEGSTMLYRNADYYSGYYWPKELESYLNYPWPEELVGNAGGIEMVYDLDLNLKSVIYREEEDMPQAQDRIEGVDYVLGKNGCLLARDGSVLICADSFLEKFGNGKDLDCQIGSGAIEVEAAGGIKELYKVDYAGETWYVDAELNAYWKEGQEALTFLDREKAGSAYYKMSWLDGLLRLRTKYFGPDGAPVAPKYLDAETADFQMCGEESYIFAQKTESGYTVEMAVPEDDYYEVLQYTLRGMTKYQKIEYLAPYMVAVSGEYENKEKALAVFTKDQMELFTAEKVSIGRLENRTDSQAKENWLVSMYSKESQTFEPEEEGRELCTYAVINDGKTRFITPTPVQRDYSACHDGYLQVSLGSQTYVYDCDGNQVIRVYNSVLAKD